MKRQRLISGGVVLFALIAILASAQGMSGKAVIISGKVSDDGKIIVSDANEKWAVSNTDALMGREGQPITVKCRLDPEKNQVRIISIRPAQSEAKYAANQGDSAFRR